MISVPHYQSWKEICRLSREKKKGFVFRMNSVLQCANDNILAVFMYLPSAINTGIFLRDRLLEKDSVST